MKRKREDEGLAFLCKRKLQVYEAYPGTQPRLNSSFAKSRIVYFDKQGGHLVARVQLFIAWAPAGVPPTWPASCAWVCVTVRRGRYLVVLVYFFWF